MSEIVKPLPVMYCDHLGCQLPPKRAPRVIVPSKTWLEPGHRALSLMTTLHYCDLHYGEFTLADALTPKIIAAFEAAAKKGRPHGFKPDFDAAFIEGVLVTTPEYRQFLARLKGVTYAA